MTLPILMAKTACMIRLLESYLITVKNVNTTPKKEFFISFS